MQINVIRTFEEMNSLQGEWNALVKQGASDVPFLRHEYLSTWWQTLGGGEWTEADLFVVTGRLADGSLAGIAPLFFSRNRSGEPALLLLGCIEISDYLDLIVPTQHISTFVNDLFTYLAGVNSPAWKVLDWYNFIELIAHPARSTRSRRPQRLDVYPRTLAALSLYPHSWRLGNLSGIH